MKIFWTTNAKEDLKVIGRYIAKDNPQAARRWVAHLKERVQKAIHAPLAGRIVPEFMREDIRELIERNYRIVYLVEKERIIVITIFEAHRLLPITTFQENLQ